MVIKRLWKGTLLLAFLLSLSACGEANPNHNSNSADLAHKAYTYMNQRYEKFSYTLPVGLTVYEKLLGPWNQEFKDNIAFAERTYQNSAAVVLTEGYIDSISKNSADGSYYVRLSEDDYNESILGLNAFDIYFYQGSPLDDLLSYQTGDYMTLLCTVPFQNISEEYHYLEAYQVLEPISNTVADPTLSGTGMTKYIGTQVGDILREFGTDYKTQWGVNGGMYLFYENGCPFTFFYDYEGNADMDIPETENLIYGVTTQKEAAEVFLGISIGATPEEIESVLPIKIIPAVIEESNFIYPYDVCQVNGLSVFFLFHPDDGSLVYAEVIDKQLIAGT